MASSKSTFATAYDAATASRVGGPSFDDVDFPRRLRRELVTIVTGVNAAGDYYDLGPCLVDGFVLIPEESRVRYPTGSTGTMTDVDLSIRKVDTAGTVVALTGSLQAASGAVAEIFPDFSSPTTLPVAAASDRLRLYLDDLTTLTVGRTFIIELGYYVSHGN